MCNFIRLNITPSMVIFTILVLLLTFRGSQSVILRQGQDLQFNFPYPCDSTSVNLRHGYRAPFFTLTGTTTQQSLSPHKENRFKVGLLIENQESKNCFLHLEINNVMRGDEGTYFSTVYRDDGQLAVDLTTSFALQINYPPGKASCTEGKNMGDEWMTLECNAERGSSPGQIVCYQDMRRVTVLTSSSEEANVLTGTFLIKKTKPAFCCSSFLRERKESCECKDIAYHPENGAMEVNDPCPTTMTPVGKKTMSFLTQMIDEDENRSPDYKLNAESHHSLPNKEFKNLTSVIVNSFLALFEVLLLLTCFIIFSMKRRK